MEHGPCSMDHVPSCLEAAASATSSAVTFDCERRDLAIPTSEATCGNLCKVGDVAIHDDAFASELHIAVEDGGGAAEHTDGGDAITPIAGTSEITDIGTKAEALLPSFEGRTIINANTVANPIRPSKRVISARIGPTVISTIVSAVIVIRCNTQRFDLIAPSVPAGQTA